MTEWFFERSAFVLYGVFFIVCLIFSLLINGLFLRFFKTLGIRNSNDGTVIRWGALSKPSVGGIAFYILFLLAIASYSILFEPSRNTYQPGYIGLLLACATGFLIGLADDAYDTKPFMKFAAQFLCGIILISSGVYVHIFENNIFNYTLTVFWVVGIMNSVNMLDNMDGITSIVSSGVIINTIYRIVIHNDFTNMHLLVLTGVLASTLAFLRFNWNPSKMYMGDTGSQFLGVFLAAMGITYFWNDPYSHAAAPATGKLIASTIITFILPILDTTVVVINRLSKGQSPFVGGKDHTTHSLAYLGLSDKQVALCFISLSICSLSLNVMIEQYLYPWTHVYSFLFGGYFVFLLVFFFYTTRNKRLKSMERLHQLKIGQTPVPGQ